jgi:predicted dehydrogenase
MEHIKIFMEGTFMNQVRVGVIGYGYWGPNLARNFHELTSSDLVVIADKQEERLKQAKSRYPQVILKTDYQELFNMELDAVIICTPPVTHFQIAKDCMEHNLHVLIEKPMTLKGADAEELIRIANERGLTLMVGHTFEYNSAVHALKKYIDSGELGEIYYLDAARLNLGLFQRDSNVLWDLAPHDISILLYLLGMNPISVSAQGTPCVLDGIHDVAYINLSFPNKISAHIHVSWLDPCKVRRVTVVGSKKMIVYNDMESESKIKIYDKGVDAPVDINSFGEFQFNYRSGDITIPNIRFTEPLRQECQHFIDCIVNHVEPCSCGRDGLAVVKILEAAQHSLTNGQTREVIEW